MKIRVTIHQGPLDIDETVEGRTEDELFRTLRKEATSRAPFMIKMALKALSDDALRQKIVEGYNRKFSTQEPVPADAKAFLDFGERAGFVTRLD